MPEVSGFECQHGRCARGERGVEQYQPEQRRYRGGDQDRRGGAAEPGSGLGEGSGGGARLRSPVALR